ncbi:helix-turn-helix transcriptional regulator [candidate division WOR-3 bacterium]|nr:helix-turn-helix transcriptional regulator [candidate division WOR-3 bacterium]
MDIKLRIFKAVAHDKRIRLIKLLFAKGRMPLRDISDLMDVPEATACRNLKILENVGLVKSSITNAIAEYWLNRDKRLSINQKVINIIINN